jgi:hypothetical protein
VSSHIGKESSMADPNALSLTALPSGSCGRPCSASSIQNRFSPLVMFLSAGSALRSTSSSALACTERGQSQCACCNAACLWGCESLRWSHCRWSGHPAQWVDACKPLAPNRHRGADCRWRLADCARDRRHPPGGHPATPGASLCRPWRGI